LAARLPVKLTPTAAAQIRRASAWWRSNRPKAPLALVEDLERAFELVSVQPGIGARAINARARGVRRLLLSRTGYYLYYQLNAREDRVEVLAHSGTSVAAKSLRYEAALILNDRGDR
jgi:plasmid stabilization system protein ParE